MSFIHRIWIIALAFLLSAGTLPPSARAAGPEWDYVALGDSLAWGIGAFNPYVPRYRDALAADTGAEIRLRNAAVPGAQSNDLLNALRVNNDLRELISAAEVVTWDIGGNDLRDARDAFKEGDCGGSDNQDCLRAAEAEVNANWDAILGEILALTAGHAPILRTMDIYNPYVDRDAGDGSLEVYKPYFDRINARIVATATAHGVRVARISLAFNGPDGLGDPDAAGLLWIDNLHPNDMGHALIAETLRGLDYAPLWPPPDATFDGVWARTDAPVGSGATARTWIWGPEPFVAVVEEPYAESTGGLRTVRYYDKSRMEISQPDADPTSIWFVTNGLLVVELTTGRVQTGDDRWEQRVPAEINVAGDADDAAGPTYATFATLRDLPPLPDGAPITQRVDRAGGVSDDPTLAARGATAAELVSVPDIEHQVASPFWAFMNSSGPIAQGDTLVEGALFPNPYYATGLPISEAYWTTVQVAGTPRDVLVQCFERRCLTWTPDNPPGWQVEAGNVGRHYYQWRYEQPGTTAPATDERAASGDAPRRTIMAIMQLFLALQQLREGIGE